MNDPTPLWSRQEGGELHRELERLAQLLFDCGGALPPAEELGQVDFSKSVAEGAVQVDGERVSFDDAEMRDEYLVRDAAKRASDGWDDPEEVLQWLTQTRRVAIRLSSSRELGALVLRLLWEVHDRDVLALVTPLARGDEPDRHRFWSLYNDFCTALPHLDAEAAKFVEACCDISEAIAGDLAAGSIYGAVEKAAKTSASVAESLVAGFHARSGTSALTFAACALVGLFQFDAETAHQRAVDWTRSTDADVRRAGLAALGRFPYPEDTPSLIAATKERLLELRGNADPDSDSALIRAHSDLLERAPDLREGLRELMGRKDPTSRHEAARVLMSWRETEAQEYWWVAGLQNLAHTPSEQGETLRLVDHALSAVTKADPHPAIQFLEDFISEQTAEGLTAADVTELFPATSKLLQDVGQEHLQAAITRWFAMTDDRFHRVAYQFIQAHSNSGGENEPKELVLDRSELSRLDERTTIDALKHILGWVVGGRPLAALVVSALERPCESADLDPVGNFVADVLADPVLYNYPGDAGDLLRRVAERNEGTRVGRLIERALATSEAYYDALRSLPQLRELQPPERRLHLIRLSRARMQARIMEEARKHSPILDLITRVPLKHGRGFFSKHGEGGFSPAADLVSFSHEVEVPRGEFIDPVGSAFHRLILRRAGWEDEREGAGPAG